MAKISHGLGLRLLGLSCLGLIAVLVSCAGPSSPGRDVVIALEYEDFLKNHDFAGTARIQTGGTLTIKLFSNATTGSLWSDPVLISGLPVLELTGHEYVPPEIPNPGAGGHEVWTYRTRDSGNCRIHADYKRFSDTTPTWTFSLTVEVF